MQPRQGQWMQRVKDDGKRSQIDETILRVRVSPVKCKTILTQPAESGGETVFLASTNKHFRVYLR